MLLMSFIKGRDTMLISILVTIKIMKLAYKLINSYEYTNDRKAFNHTQLSITEFLLTVNHKRSRNSGIILCSIAIHQFLQKFTALKHLLL